MSRHTGSTILYRGRRPRSHLKAEYGTGLFWTPQRESAFSYGDTFQSKYPARVAARKISDASIRQLKGRRFYYNSKAARPLKQAESEHEDLYHQDNSPDPRAIPKLRRRIRKKYPNTDYLWIDNDEDVHYERHETYVPLSKKAKRVVAKGAPRRMQRRAAARKQRASQRRPVYGPHLPKQRKTSSVRRDIMR